MKTKLRLLVLFSIFYSTIGIAQEDNTKNKIEFSIGHTFGHLKNLEFAPVSRYTYNGFVYKLIYKRMSKHQNLFEVTIDYLSSDLKTNVSPNLETDYSKMGVDFLYLKQVYNKSELSIHLGLQSQTNVSLYFHSEYFVMHQEFGLASRFSYQLDEKQHLTSKLTIPIVLIRITNSDGKFHSLNRYQSVLWNLEYGYSLSKHFDAKISYDFDFDRLQIPNAFRELQHQFNLGINYKF